MPSRARRRIPLECLMLETHSVHLLLNFAVQVQLVTLLSRHSTSLIVKVGSAHLNRVLLLSRGDLKHLAVVEQCLLVHIEAFQRRSSWLGCSGELEVQTAGTGLLRLPLQTLKLLVRHSVRVHVSCIFPGINLVQSGARG